MHLNMQVVAPNMQVDGIENFWKNVSFCEKKVMFSQKYFMYLDYDPRMES